MPTALWHYAAFLVLSMTALSAYTILIGQRLDQRGGTRGGQEGGSLSPCDTRAAYVFSYSGFCRGASDKRISTDVVPCRARPGMSGTIDTIYPERASALCPTGIAPLFEPSDGWIVNDALLTTRPVASDGWREDSLLSEMAAIVAALDHGDVTSQSLIGSHRRNGASNRITAR